MSPALMDDIQFGWRATWLAALALVLSVPVFAGAQESGEAVGVGPESAETPPSAEASPLPEAPAETEAVTDEATPLPRIALPDLGDLLPEDWPAATNPPPTIQPGGNAPPQSPMNEFEPPSAPQAGGGSLPWEKAVEVPEAPVLRPPDGPLEILERFDIGPSQMEGFFNGEAWSPSEEETLIRILYRFPRLGLDNLMRWRKKDVGWDQVVAGPWNYRGQIFRLQGRVKRVVREEIAPQMAERFEMSHYFRVTLDVDNTPFTAEVLARRVPEAWKLDADLDEPAATDAMFLKIGEQLAAPSPPLIFAAGSVAWFPEKADPELHIGPDQLKLIQHGLDWSNFDKQFRQGNGGQTLDREPFYQLLDLVSRVDLNELIEPGTEPLEVVPLLAKPAERHGDIVLVKGTAKRIIKVLVEDRDIRARYGVDHYFEIDMFLPLGKTSVRMGKDPTGEDNPVYNNAFPATLIVRELPPGVVEGENLNEPLETAAVFFKVWSYRANYTEQFKKLQPAPLFIAERPESYRELRPSHWLTDIFVGGAMGTAVLVLIAVLWWFQRSDRVHRAELKKSGTTAPGAEPSGPPDFSNVTTTDGPDFSKLK